MADLPILFSGSMVRAILREIEQPGTGKTQTRRVLNPQPATFTPHVIDIGQPYFDDDEGRWGQIETEWSSPGWDAPMGEPMREIFVPLPIRIKVGDRLYVRETWAPLDALTHSDPGTQALADRGFYRADDSTVEGEISRWRPGIHMPRWASRITLIVTDVRVQRLQEISQEDAIAEGPGFVGKITGEVCESVAAHRLGIGPRWRTPRDWYADLWDSLNAYRGHGWEANPWVAAYTFRPILGNIDEVPACP